MRWNDEKGPILHVLHVVVLDWIEVNVIHVSSKIAVVADRVLPEAACQMPRSRLRKRLAEMPSSGCSPRENVVLMSRQRVAKSLSPAATSTTHEGGPAKSRSR